MGRPMVGPLSVVIPSTTPLVIWRFENSNWKPRRQPKEGTFMHGVSKECTPNVGPSEESKKKKKELEIKKLIKEGR